MLAMRERVNHADNPFSSYLLKLAALSNNASLKKKLIGFTDEINGFDRDDKQVDLPDRNVSFSRGMDFSIEDDSFGHLPDEIIVDKIIPYCDDKTLINLLFKSKRFKKCESITTAGGRISLGQCYSTFLNDL